MKKENSKSYAVVLNRDWANELGSIIEPYLLPCGSLSNNLPVIYAKSIETNAPFVELGVTSNEGFDAIIRIPHGAILFMAESDSKKNIGFISE